MDKPFNQQSFNALLAEQKLMGGRCCDCQALFVPPRPMCSDCASNQMEWIPLSGRGTLKTFTSISVVAPQMAALGYGRDKPYCTGVVALAENCRIVARIEGVDARAPETVRVGMPLQARIVTGDKTVDLVFEPVADGGGAP